MRTTFSILALAAAPLALAQDADAPSVESLHRDLALAVDHDTPKARRKAARELAKRAEVPIEAWLEAMRTFPCREEPTPGSRVEVVKLRVDGEVEETELAIHVPPTYDPSRPAPLMVTLHGTGGGGMGVLGMWRELADDLGMLVLAPSEAGPNEGFAATPRERAAVLAALRWMRRTFNVDENKVFLSGFSRGGHLTWDVSLRYPDLFAGISPMVGGPRWVLTRGAANMRYLENLWDLPIHDLQGAHDDPRLVWNVREAFSILEKLGAVNAKYHEFPDRGHAVDFGAVDWHVFLGSTVRDPVPERVVRRFAREGEGRSRWVEVLQGDREVKEDFQPRVKASAWNKLDEEGQRRFMIEAAEERTARLEVRFVRPGIFEADVDQVPRFRLLLTEEMFDPDDEVVVKVGTRRQKKKVRPNKGVLLEEFVERFDRTFLPVAEIELKGR